jgi:hypothetical protein
MPQFGPNYRRRQRNVNRTYRTPRGLSCGEPPRNLPEGRVAGGPKSPVPSLYAAITFTPLTFQPFERDFLGVQRLSLRSALRLAFADA